MRCVTDKYTIQVHDKVDRQYLKKTHEETIKISVQQYTGCVRPSVQWRAVYQEQKVLQQQNLFLRQPVYPDLTLYISHSALKLSNPCIKDTEPHLKFLLI